ncbi:MAG TPA: BatA and WFA domain-containing protein, partial [Acidimicrobiales bacterium]|nr:BatA and WFA domain-containing protein [Acidimicrobiales bacterium]
MRFANPAGLWLAALAVPVVLLYVLRPRRPPVEVSSTYLWEELSDPVSVASPWQRLRPSLLLALQLLAVLLLAAAAAQPVRATAAPLARHTVFIVDASGSMAAADGRPDRLGAAVARARDLRDQLPAGGVASVVVASPQPRVVLSSSPDRRAFDEAVGAIRTTAGAADFATAFSLAESLETPATPVGFLLLSDGGLTNAEQALIPPGTRYVRIGSQSTNRAISRLTVEPRGSGLHARVSLRNTGGPAATQQLRIDVDGVTAHRERVTLEPGAALEREVGIPAGDRIEAFLEGEDLLAADNRAVAVASARRPLRALWAGPDDLYLDRLLAVLPELVVERAPEGRPAPGYDLAIYAGVP